MYEALGRERYVLRRLAATKIQTFAFDWDAFHPAQSQREGPVFLELVHNGVSQIARLDLKTYSLNPTPGTEWNATGPALSRTEGDSPLSSTTDCIWTKADGGILAGARPGGEPGILLGWESDRVCLGSALPALHRGDFDIRWRDTNPGRGPGLLRAGRLAGRAPAGICLFGDRRASGLGA